MSRFAKYKLRQKLREKRLKAEVVNGFVWYATDEDIRDAARSALFNGRARIIGCEKCGEEPKEGCPNCGIELCDEDGNIISHEGNMPEGFEGTLQEWIRLELKFNPIGVKLL
jgi:hypothetical protein